MSIVRRRTIRLRNFFAVSIHFLQSFPDYPNARYYFAENRHNRYTGDMSSLKEAVKAVYEMNLRHHGKLTYTVPSPDTYPFQWFWDSCFHAITLSYIDVARAKNELRLLVTGQFKNGMIPHILYWRVPPHNPFPEIHWGKRRTSTITQPPMLAMAVWRIYEATGDIAFVREMLPHIDDLHRYLFRNRDPHHLNLAGIVNPDESGEDNSPRFDRVLGLADPRHQFVDNFKARLKLVDDLRTARFVLKNKVDLKHWVYDVPFNAILAESLRITGIMARHADQQTIALFAEAKAVKVRTSMYEIFRHQHLYQSVYGPKLRHISVRTWAMFMPLYAGVASDSEARYVVENFLRNKREFASPYRVPTVSISEPGFDPSGDWKGDWWIGTNWRGPVWMASNWFVLQGLLRYGYIAEAKQIYQSSLQLIKQSGFREYYDPLTGQGHGATNFTWSGLILDMEELIKTTAHSGNKT